MTARRPGTLRNLPRNVIVFDCTTSHPSVVAGVWQCKNSWTQTKFYSALQLCFDTSALPDDWCLVCRSSQSRLSARSSAPLPLGEYYVASPELFPCPVVLSTEPSHFRSITPDTTPHRAPWSLKVKTRDGCCVATGLSTRTFIGLHAAHIVQLTLPRVLSQSPRSDYELMQVSAEQMAELENSALRSRAVRVEELLNSPENGITLSETVHTLFDSFHFAFDVDDDYRIVPFSEDAEQTATAGLRIGQSSERLLRFGADQLDRPSDVLLKWHFHQAILSHVRGSGEVKDHKYEDELYQGSVDLSEDQWVKDGRASLEGFFEHALHVSKRRAIAF